MKWQLTCVLVLCAAMLTTGACVDPEDERVTVDMASGEQALNLPAGRRTNPTPDAPTLFDDFVVDRDFVGEFVARGFELEEWELCTAQERAQGACTFRFVEYRPRDEVRNWVYMTDRACNQRGTFCRNRYLAPIRIHQTFTRDHRDGSATSHAELWVAHEAPRSRGRWFSQSLLGTIDVEFERGGTLHGFVHMGDTSIEFASPIAQNVSSNGWVQAGVGVAASVAGGVIGGIIVSGAAVPVTTVLLAVAAGALVGAAIVGGAIWASHQIDRYNTPVQPMRLLERVQLSGRTGHSTQNTCSELNGLPTGGDTWKETVHGRNGNVLECEFQWVYDNCFPVPGEASCDCGRRRSRNGCRQLEHDVIVEG